MFYDVPKRGKLYYSRVVVERIVQGVRLDSGWAILFVAFAETAAVPVCRALCAEDSAVTLVIPDAARDGHSWPAAFGFARAPLDA